MVLIKTARDAYSAYDAMDDTMTVKELTDHLLENFPKDEKVVISCDGGISFGYINKKRITQAH